MAPIVDIKAAERAVLSTEFHPVGGRLNTAASKQRPSRVMMKRIHGLNDKDEWGTGPVFETKLYYRLDEATKPRRSGVDDNDVDLNDIAGDDDDDDDNMPLAERLVAQMPLETYKDDKFKQLERWHQHHRAEDAEEAERKRSFAGDRIYGAVDVESVDKYVKEYYDWYQQQEWLSKNRSSGRTA